MRSFTKKKNPISTLVIEITSYRQKELLLLYIIGWKIVHTMIGGKINLNVIFSLMPDACNNLPWYFRLRKELYGDEYQLGNHRNQQQI